MEPIRTPSPLLGLFLGLVATLGPASWLQAQEPATASESEPAQQAPDADQPSFVEEIDVRERADVMVGIAVSASEGSTGYLDLQKRPILRPGDVVETVPGMVATQHSGGGKANQFFVRGFNLDHGTDFAISVGGIPVNMPTHGHGQGYADLNFLIPEVVERARFRKGPYWADVGDFSSAGSLDIDLMRRMPERLVTVTGGSFDYGRALFADSFALGRSAADPAAGGDLLVAVEGFHDDGPWTTRGDDYDGGKAVVRWTTGDAGRGLSLTAMGYDASWLATDQIPQRAIDQGVIGRFDLLAEGPRGDTQRLTLSADGHYRRGNIADHFNLYAMSYDFLLVGDFTYFLGDPERGDEVTQLDDRTTFGGEVSRSWYFAGSLPVELVAGAQMRYDQIGNGLLLSENAVPYATAREDDIDLFGGGLFVETRVKATDWLRASVGLRYQAFDGSVTSLLPENSGDIDDDLLSPKLSLALGPWADTEIYLNYGQGMHSNDARGAVLRIDPLSGARAESADPLIKTEGFDFGFRTVALDGLQSTLTFFQLDLDSELIFVGDAGVTEAGRPSRRQGIEWTNHYRISTAWDLDFDLTFTDAEFRDPDPAGNEVPGAVGTTVASGVNWDRGGPWTAGLRWRYFGDIPLVEDGSVEWSSSSTLNGRIGYRFSSGLALTVDVFNLLDKEQSDVEYFYASRLPGEPLEGVEDIHIHPASKRAVRLSVSFRR